MIARSFSAAFWLSLTLACWLGTLSSVRIVAAQPQQVDQTSKIRILRDAEIEELLNDYARPLMKAAGLSTPNARIIVVQGTASVVFALDQNRIAVSMGAIFESIVPNELIGLIAHEIGHLSQRDRGDHLLSSVLARRHIAKALTEGSPKERPKAYFRNHEDAADYAAVTVLNATSQSAAGLIRSFQRFAQQALFDGGEFKASNVYLFLHLISPDRLSALEKTAIESPHYNKKDPDELIRRHDMVRAKIAGYFDRPDPLLRRYPHSNTSLAARYARAMSAYRWGNIRSALDQIDTLIAEQAGNPYFHELKGLILLESGKPSEAVAPLRRAVELSKGSSLIRLALGQALVQSANASLLDEALRELRFALQSEPQVARGWQQLAVAYAKKGDSRNADLAAANAAFYEGDIATAKTLALRAQQAFPVGSPGWIRAEEIIRFKSPTR